VERPGAGAASGTVPPNANSAEHPFET
jgi:hypothetical protein